MSVYYAYDVIRMNAMHVYIFDICCDANSIKRFDTSKGITYTTVFKLMEPCFLCFAQRTYGLYGQSVLVSPVV